MEVKLLVGWWATGADRDRSDATRVFLLRAAEELEAHRMKEGGEYLSSTTGIDHTADEFGDLCAMAQASGTRVALEFMPFTNVPNLEVGSELINTTDHAFGGLIVDIWHVMHSGTFLSSLRGIPLCGIFGVELNDADLDLVGDLFEDTMILRFPAVMASSMFKSSWRYVRHRVSGRWGGKIIGEEYPHQPIEESIPYASSPHVVSLISWNDKGLPICGKLSEFHVLCAFQAE